MSHIWTFFRRMARSVLTTFRTFVVHRHLIATLVRRDLRGRYASSIMGLSWAVIQPLVLLLLYTFLFSIVLRVRLGEATSPSFFATYAFCGMLPWIAVQEGIIRSSTSILENVQIIKKVVFPSEVLPATAVLSTLVLESIGLGVFLLVLSLSYALPGPALFILPVVIVFQAMFTLGLGWVLASLTVFLRDVGQLLGLGMTFWMFMTPIFYPAEMVPPHFAFILLVNPMYYLISAYRNILLWRAAPNLGQLALFSAIALLVFVVGGWFFRRSSHAFADVI